MKLTHFVKVDYDELAEHLQLYYRQDDKDSPLSKMSFEHFREVIDQHVEDMMDADAFATDTRFTEILLKRLTFGTLTDIFVSRVPGHVVNTGRQSFIMPLILLEIDY
jgi:hypothetical protein